MPFQHQNNQTGGVRLFGSTKRKLNLSPDVDYDFYRPHKVNYSIPCPNTRAICQCIEELLSFVEHGVAHTTSLLETNCLASKWQIARLSPNSAKHYWALHAITRTLYNVKVGNGNMIHMFLHTKGLRRNIVPPTIWSMISGFAMTTSSIFWIGVQYPTYG